jgi:hypothetical protein
MLRDFPNNFIEILFSVHILFARFDVEMQFMVVALVQIVERIG